MIGDIFQPTHLLFVLIVALLVLGPKRLPEVAKTLGTGIRDFRSAISGESTDSSNDEPAPHISSYEPPQSVAPDAETTSVAEPVGATAAVHSEPEHATTSEPVSDPATFHFPTRPPIDTDDAAADTTPTAAPPAPVDDQAETRQFEPEHGSTSA